MFKKKLKFGLVVLSMMMLAGCGKKETTDSNTNVNNTASADTSVETNAVAEGNNATDSGATTSDAYYTVDKDGKYTYNTDLFDPEKFSGTVYVHNIAFQLPLDCETFAASNIYVGEKDWFEGELGYEGNAAKETIDAGDDDKHTGLIYKKADSAAEDVKGYGTMILFNPTDKELPVNQCQIGRYDTSLNGFSSMNEAAWKLFYGEEEGAKRSADSFNIDTVMELCGAPAAVVYGNMLIYPYENYVIIFSNFNGDRADMVYIYSWDYLQDEIDECYDAIPETYRYGH